MFIFFMCTHVFYIMSNSDIANILFEMKFINSIFLVHLLDFLKVHFL